MRRKTIAAAVLTLAVGGSLMLAGQSFAARSSASEPAPATGSVTRPARVVPKPATDQRRAVAEPGQRGAVTEPAPAQRRVAPKPVAEQRRDVPTDRTAAGPATDARTPRTGPVDQAAPKPATDQDERVVPRDRRSDPAPATRP